MNEKKTAPEVDRELSEVKLLKRLLNADFSSCEGGERMILENILALCRERGVNVAQLEKACGLGNATVRGWATADPQVSKLKRVADFFGCTVDDLLKK